MVKKFSLILLCLILLSCTESQKSIDNPDKSVSGAQGDTVEGSLPFKIVELERQPKGAGQYVLFGVRAVLQKEPLEITEANIRKTLQSLLRQVQNGAWQRSEQIDGISAYLYASEVHHAGGSGPLGRIEWWPKGHSFSHTNVANIKTKATYVETIHINDLLFPKKAKSVVERLSKSERRAIFTDLVRSQDRAEREAEAKYPLDGSNIPIGKLKTYDWKTDIEKHSQENEKLRLKYEEELLRQYDITKEELKVIRREAFTEQWPLPPMD